MKRFESVGDTYPLYAEGVNPVKIVSRERVKEKDIREDRDQPSIPDKNTRLERVVFFLLFGTT